MKLVQCPRCRARRPESMPSCPVCDGRCGRGPELLKVEQRETSELRREMGEHGWFGALLMALFQIL